MKNCGIFTISIDVELAWGFCDKPVHGATRAAIGREREVVRRLLALFSRYDVRATWAIVGHLLLTDCNRAGERVHPEIYRPVTKSGGRDWFFQHPTNGDDPLWYGRELVEWIKQASPPQEIGSHSFCHVPYHEGWVNREAVQTDIAQARTLHRAYGLPFEAFIFPRNIVGYRELLARAGVRVYRGRTLRWFDAVPTSAVRRLLHLVSWVFATPPRTVKATVDETGMVNIPDSMFFSGRNGLRSLIPSRSLVAMGRVGVDRAVERGEIFHLWFHPSNFVHKMDGQFATLETILRYAQRLRQSGRLEVLTMGDIQRRVSAPAGGRERHGCVGRAGQDPPVVRGH